MNKFITLALAIGLAFAGSAQDRSQGGISPDMMRQIVATSANNTNKAVSNAMATNAIDKVYQSHLSRLKYADYNPVTGHQGVFDMGRNVVFKIALPLEW